MEETGVQRRKPLALHLAQITPQKILNFPLTYPCALFYIYIHPSPYPYPHVKVLT